MTIKVKMMPSEIKTATDGISQVVRAYLRYLPQFDIEFVHADAGDFDLVAAHAGFGEYGCQVSHCHGLYWTADLAGVKWEYFVNSTVIKSLRESSIITVPSDWVGEAIQRDMHRWPITIPHGIEWRSWQNADAENEHYVLWNKNRAGDVCDPGPVARLADVAADVKFVSTFLPANYEAPNQNVKEIGLTPHKEMKKIIQNAGVYLATTKETFGIGILEAMASGVPVLGFDHGGMSELVQHGVSGFLAKPGDFEELAEGLNYCLKHGDILGSNAREAAKAWSWENACRRVADVYKMALDGKQDPAVSVIIPVYNKSPEQVARAIASAHNQEFPPAEVIVVDDGSDNPDIIDAVVTEFVGLSVETRVIHQENRGVAYARNAGIEAAKTPFVCCLDADDAIAPEFLRHCVSALVNEPTLGVAYTKITWVDQDGNSGLSDWPGEYDFDAFLKKRNQIPTCSVFRRKAWEQVGGYRQRYAPTGAGAEDAEFWLRLGARGWGGKLVTNKGLFIYSVGGGFVSGNKEYREVDWRAWHPWTRDNLHPFASVAAPEFISHPVRQYDEPIISVVIPVGPGHAEDLWNALDSLEAQNFRKWEAVVVWDGYDFDAPEIVAAETAFPFIRSVQSYVDKPGGAGRARNLGVEFSRAPFLVFLDADDWLYPDALMKMMHAWNETSAIIYTDYVGRAIIAPDDESKLSPDLQKRIYYRNEKTNEVVIGHSALDYDCEVAQTMPAPWKDGNPYIWANVTVLIPTAWHNEIGGFDESMASWEDVDYHWRLAFAGKCYHRLRDELLVYNFHKGSRREGGLLFFRDLIEYLRSKYKGVSKMACSGCGGRKVTSPTAQPSRVMVANERPPSTDFALVVYNHSNIGDHLVIGQGVFQAPLNDVSMVRTPEGWRINYQYKGGGEKFFVHRRDIEAQPSIFIELNEGPVNIPQQPRPTPRPEQQAPPPMVAAQTARAMPEAVEPVEPKPPEIAVAPDAHISAADSLPGTLSQAVRDAFAALDDLPNVKASLPVEAIGNPQAPPDIFDRPVERVPTQVIHDDDTDNEIAVPDIGHKIAATSVDLQLLPGVGAAGAARMAELGLTSEEAILSAADNLVQIPGISKTRAAGIVQFIEQSRANRAAAAAAAESEGSTDEN